MKIEEIEKAVNVKVLNLFKKLLELTPFQITSSEFYYNYNNEILGIGISNFKNKYEGYKYPELHKYGMFEYHPNFESIASSETWKYYLILPKPIIGYSYSTGRQITVPITDEIELLEIKKKLLLKHQEYELTFLDKYLVNSIDLPF